MPLPLERCPSCGYDLAGLGKRDGGLCPECGIAMAPRVKQAARSMPGVGLTLLGDVALGVLLLAVVWVYPPNTLGEMGLFLLTVLGLIPITGFVSFARARVYSRSRIDAWEEWILSVVVAFATVLVGGFVLFTLR